MNDTIHPEKLALFAEVCSLYPGTDCTAQRSRVRAVLERGYPLNTLEASRYLDVYYCPARVFELRDEGMNIATHWTTVQTEAGATHRVGNYLEVREVRDAA